MGVAVNLSVLSHGTSYVSFAFHASRQQGEPRGRVVLGEESDRVDRIYHLQARHMQAAAAAAAAFF